MATASSISFPNTASTQEYQVAQPASHSSGRAKWEILATSSVQAAELVAVQDADESLKCQPTRGNAAQENRLDAGDVVQLLLLVGLGSLTIILPGIWVTKLLASVAQFNALDIVRMMAGMP